MLVHIGRAVKVRESGRSAAHHSPGIVTDGGDVGLRKSGRQSRRFLDSHPQTGEELAKVDGRHAAIADRDDVVGLASGRQLPENVLCVVEGIVERTVDLVGQRVSFENVHRTYGTRKSSRFNSAVIRKMKT